MKFSLLTLGALALSAQQASTVRGEEGTSGQQPQEKNVCKQNSSLSFNITQAGESVLFTCDEAIKNLDPAFNATAPEMYEGGNKVGILEFLPEAKLEEVKTTTNSEVSSRTEDKGKTYNFTVPVLPSEEHNLYVNCTATSTTASRNGDSSKDCKVSFYIASSAVRPVLAMTAVVGVIGSLLQFA
ncbi:UNVERIFIED_CONTAM: SAG-related sequence protein SRS22I [Hammondia hammondi]|eukprot:XP_008887532.1 SAG-related sequence protein SRS22I [Hammondia hammondi]